MAKRRKEPLEDGSSAQEIKAVAVSSDNAAARDSWRNVRLITAREYKNQVSKRGYLISTIILLSVVAIAAFIPTIIQLIAEKTKTQTQVVLVNSAGPIAGLDDTALVAYVNTILNGADSSVSPRYKITSQPSADLENLQNQVTLGKLPILLLFGRAANQDLSLTYYSKITAPADIHLTRIQILASQITFLDTASRLGLTPAQTQSLFAPADFSVVRAQAGRSQSQYIAGYVLAFAGAFLIYLPVVLYSNIVATGVAEEKSSRVMEILVNIATPFQLLAGKVVGIGAACLLQMTLLVLVGVGALLLQTPIQTALFGTQSADLSRYLTSIGVPFYFLFLVYFLLHFLLFATLFAGLGAMVKRQDEVASIVQVPTMLSVIGWILVYVAVINPDANWVKLLSYFPFFTAELMMVRIGLGTIHWWDIVSTVSVLVLFIMVCVWFAARAYRLGVLMYGQVPSLGQLIKMVRES